MDTVARALGLSARSLRRRLVSEGTSYKAIENDALAVVATELLRDSRRTIQEAACEMGFSDTAPLRARTLAEFCRDSIRRTSSDGQ